MGDYPLQGEHFVKGTQRYYGSTYLAELFEHSIVSIAIPRHGENAFHSQFQNAFGIVLPSPGTVKQSMDKRFEFLWMSPEQIFVYFKSPSHYPEHEIRDVMGALGYVTDQTHNWCQIKLEGQLVVPALERICPLNLHQDVFPVGGCARTVMEHLSTVLVRRDSDEFLFFSPSSSAHSFVHTIEQSLLNVGDF